MLKIEKLHIAYHKDKILTPVVFDISLEIKTGEIVALVGESGCGKSSIAHAIMGLLPISAQVSGEVLFNEENLLQISAKKMLNIRGNKIGMIFQNPTGCLNPTRKIGNQIVETILEHQSVTKHEAKSIALDWLHRVNISDPELRFEQYPFEFSGGMCQRIMIAIALCCRPALLIADEPTTALDPSIRLQIIELFKQIRKKFGISILFITHDLGTVAGLCDRLNVMHNGKIVESGPVDSIFYSPSHLYTKKLLDAQNFLTHGHQLAFT